MSETVFSLITSYGAYVIFASAFLSCLALPIPTSLMMLTGGAFVASQDLVLWEVVGAAYAGAVIGDQTGYFIGRYGGTPLIEKIARSPARLQILNRARGMVDSYGDAGVFFSTWLTAPLGPWVNFIAGATGLSWPRFAIWDVLGEVVWVSVYVGLGYAFASNISAIASIMSNLVGLIAALAVAGAMIMWIRGAMKHDRAGKERKRNAA